MKIILFLAIIGMLYYIWDLDNLDSISPGAVVVEAPYQEYLDEPALYSLNDGKYTMRRKAEFIVNGRVLSRHTYDNDATSDISPIDLALGWQKMSDSAIISQLKINQSHRYYRWKTKGRDYPLGITRAEIIAQSANMHMIPADADVLRRLMEINQYDIVKIEGYLVEIKDPKTGLRWDSSESRTDSGGGACEIIYVEDVVIK